MRSIFLIIFYFLFTAGCTSVPKGSAPRQVSGARSIHNFVYFGRDRERIYEAGFLSTEKLEGAQLMYSWKELEPEENNYEFKEIQNDLSFLQSRSKKLFIQLQDATFDPTLKAVPSYLLKNKKYQGGIALQYDDKGNAEGTVARRWDSAVQERFHRLLRALGKS